MIQILPEEDHWGNAFRNAGEGVVKGYETRSDDMALQKSVGDLGPNATPREILDAITKTNTYNPEAKQTLLKNYLGVDQFEELRRQHKETTEVAREKNQVAQLKEILRAKAKEDEQTGKTQQKVQEAENEAKEAKTILKEAGKTEEEANQLVDEGKIGPVSARTLTKPIEQTFEKESDKLGAQRAHKYISGVEEAAKAAQGDIVALDLADSLADEGATGFKLSNAVADFLESKGIKAEALRDPLSKAFNSASKVLFRGFGETVKGKVSNYEFGVFKNMLAQAEDSPQAAKAMIETQRLIRQLDIKENDMMQEVLKEYAAKGQSPPSNIAHLVEQRFRPIADQMVRQTTSNLQKILHPSKNIKNQALNDRLWEETMKGKK